MVGTMGALVVGVVGDADVVEDIDVDLGVPVEGEVEIPDEVGNLLVELVDIAGRVGVGVVVVGLFPRQAPLLPQV
jgi:hypothetical protein